MGYTFHSNAGYTRKFWGLELTLDFNDGYALCVRVGPFYAYLEWWRETP